VPTAAGASVRESAFAEKTLVMFVMVGWRARLCYAEQREVRGIKSSAERERDELVEREGKVDVPVDNNNAKENKAHQTSDQILFSFLFPYYVISPTVHGYPSFPPISAVTALVTAFAPSRTAALSPSLTRGMTRPSNLSG
jgi:hypothetical protein